MSQVPPSYGEQHNGYMEEYMAYRRVLWMCAYSATQTTVVVALVNVISLNVYSTRRATRGCGPFGHGDSVTKESHRYRFGRKKEKNQDGSCHARRSNDAQPYQNRTKQNRGMEGGRGWSPGVVWSCCSGAGHKRRGGEVILNVRAHLGTLFI